MTKKQFRGWVKNKKRKKKRRRIKNKKITA